jgi:exosome complex component RRP45
MGVWASLLCRVYLEGTDSSLVVLDPTHLEQQTCTGTLVLTLNAQREICVLTKAGGSPMSLDGIMRLVTLASERVKDLEATVAGALAEDSKGRVLGVM